MSKIVSVDVISEKIFLIRGLRVLLDQDLAQLYGVETKTLIRAVKRNMERFPEDFMFQMTKQEFENLRRHFGTSSQWGGRRYSPYAFTEQGISMLSSVLKSKQAIEVNIAIMRAFVKLREILSQNKELRAEMKRLEDEVDAQFQAVFEVIRRLMDKTGNPYKITGFRRGKK
jgi:phage regulator Rha-like protein